MVRSVADDTEDADRTRQEPAGPATLRDPARLVRGAVLAGKYRLELQLGEGGMAVVWSAYHLELEIPVAIKLLRGHDPRLAQRLKLEARAAARLAHPAIVRVLDVATTDYGDPFIVMEQLTGETLGDVLARGNVSAARVVQLLLPIAEGLALAHDHGVVHRDLKPENVLLATDGEQLQPKLLDFGIAKLAGRVPATRLTQNGTTLGSPSYMSPEQARGDEVDHLSDIWSFCVLLYKAIGGKAPFRGATPRDTLDAILERDPAPLPVGAGVDDHLARIVLSGLNKDPAARPASMRLLGQQLARWLLLHGVSVDACGTPLTSKWPSPLRSPNSASEITSRLLARAKPVVRRSHAVGRSKLRFAVPKSRRWVLWALAGVLVAGGSLALTSANGSPNAEAQQQSRLAARDAPVLTGTDADFRTPEQRLEQALAVGDASTTTSNPAASEATTASTATPSPATTVPRASGPQRTKSSAPNSRSALPF